MPQTPTVSRRALTKGAAWSLPVVVAASAVPAMAASGQTNSYYTAKSVDGSYYSSLCTLSNFSVTTEYGIGGEQPGFSMGYTEGAAEDTTATLSSLQFVMAVPKGMVVSPTVDNSSWTMSGPTGATSLTIRGGASVSTSGYDVYVLTFKGTMTNPVVVESETTAWPGTTFTISATSGSYCSSTASIYTGYRGAVTTTNGFSATINSIQPQTLRAS